MEPVSPLDGKTVPITLDQVRAALKAGDKAYARQLLALVLHRNPSADAWVMAARLTNDQGQAIAHLHRALFIEPQHGDALTMLQLLGAQPQSPLKTLTTEIVAAALQPPPARTSRERLRMLGVRAIIVLLLIAFTLVLYVTINAPRPLAISSTVPDSVTPVIYDAQTVMRALIDSEVPLARIEQATDANNGAKQILRLMPEGEETTSAEIWVYESIAALVDDGAALAGAELQSNITAYGNLVLLYSPELNTMFRKQLLHALQLLSHPSSLGIFSAASL